MDARRIMVSPIGLLKATRFSNPAWHTGVGADLRRDEVDRMCLADLPAWGCVSRL